MSITKINTNKNYAVVTFMESNSCSEIPTNWLLYDNRFKGKIACRWPSKSVKNVTQRIKNRETPSKDWPIYEIRILKYCSTLESARKAADDSQYSSASETFGRGHRIRKVTSPVREALKLQKDKHPIYSSSSDDDDEQREPVLVLPQFPKNSTPESTSHSKKNNQEEFSEEDVDSNDSDSSVSRTLASANALINSCQQGKPGAIATGNCGVRDKDTDVQDTDKLGVLEAKLDTCVYLLGKLITEVKDLKQRSVSNNSGNSGLNSAISADVESHLKLDTREGVAAFETRLKTCKKFEDEFARKIKQVGGANGKDFTERALAFIFSNKFAKENTWEGKITKFKVNTLKVIDICEKVILEKFPTWDKAEFSKAGTNWFRLGNQRAGEQPKQVIKKTTLTDQRDRNANGNSA